MQVAVGSTSKRLTITIVDDSGLPVDDLTSADVDHVLWKRSGQNSYNSLDLSDLSSSSQPWTSGGFIFEVEGRYRLDADDMMFAVADTEVSIWREISGKRVICSPIQVGSIDPTAAENAAATAAALTDIDVTIQSLYQSGTLTVYKGAEISVEQGNSVSFPFTTLPDLTAGDAKVVIKTPRHELRIEHALDITGAGGATQTIVLEIPAAKTALVYPPETLNGFILYKTATAADYSPAVEFAVKTKEV